MYCKQYIADSLLYRKLLDRRAKAHLPIKSLLTANKKGRFSPALPLRHVGHIVIWEGNYRSDIIIFD
jgi:hypothetical protein